MPNTDTHRPSTDPVERADDAHDDLVVVGDGRVRCSPAALGDDLPTVDREVTVACASGERTTATWTGVPVADLLAAVDAPPDTTHLQLGCADGYTVCVPVRDALDAVVAVARDGTRLADVEPYATRFVGPDVDGERCVKGLVRVETHGLPPDADPEDLEDLALDGPGFD